MNEQSILHRILFACGTGATRLFRNNTGVAWAGKRVDPIRGNPRMVLCHDGDVVVRAAQPIKYGLCVGSSDLIGWTRRDGQAVFTAIEVKTDRGRPTAEQSTFIAHVQAAGGIAGIARSEAEALALLTDER